MKLKITILIIISCIIISGCTSFQKTEPDQQNKLPADENPKWNSTLEGLDYLNLQVKTGEKSDSKNLIIVRIDPDKYQFSIYENQTLETAKTIKEIHTAERALVSVNGGFFTEDFKPTGLLLSKGKILRKKSPAELLNGIFAIDQNGNPKLISEETEFKPSDFIFAIQNGPVLIDRQGKIAISKDTGKSANRTAIGLDKDGNNIIIVLKQSLLNPDNTVTLYEFAHLLKEDPFLKQLALHSVLNLDGGPSTGMMISDQYFPEMEKVQNVILIM